MKLARCGGENQEMHIILVAKVNGSDYLEDLGTGKKGQN
jgi:hypothetical protein